MPVHRHVPNYRFIAQKLAQLEGVGAHRPFVSRVDEVGFSFEVHVRRHKTQGGVERGIGHEVVIKAQHLALQVYGAEALHNFVGRGGQPLL